MMFITRSLATQLMSLVVFVADLTLESFPADFEDRRVIYWHGLDNESRKICKLVVFLPTSCPEIILSCKVVK